MRIQLKSASRLINNPFLLASASSVRPEKAENLIQTPTPQWGSASSRFTLVDDPRDKQRGTASVGPTTQAVPSATFGP